MRRRSVLAALAAVAVSGGACVHVIQRDRPIERRPAVEPAQEPAETKGLDAREALRATALSRVGTPYRYGGEGADGLDCSALTQKVYGAQGIEIPRTVFDQFKKGTPRWRSELKPGDLVFFETQAEAGATHVGIFVGDGRFVHAPSTGKAVEVSSLTEAYWKNAFLAGRAYLID